MAGSNCLEAWWKGKWVGIVDGREYIGVLRVCGKEKVMIRGFRRIRTLSGREEWENTASEWEYDIILRVYVVL